MSTTTVLQQTQTENQQSSYHNEIQDETKLKCYSNKTDNENRQRNILKKLSRQNSIHQLVNSYIYDPTLLYLPNVITWLKTSKLQDYIEWLLNYTKSAMFTFFMYFILLLKLKNFTSEFIKKCFVSIKTIRSKLYTWKEDNGSEKKITKSNHNRIGTKDICDEKNLFNDTLSALKNNNKTVVPTKSVILKQFIFKSAIYLVVSSVYIQLIAIFIALNSSSVPNGLIFLLSALSGVIFIAFVVMQTTVTESKKIKVAHNSKHAQHKCDSSDDVKLNGINDKQSN